MDAEQAAGQRAEPARVVVGVDGSECSMHAVEWAAREAQLRDARLEVVHVLFFPRDALDEYAPDIERHDNEVLRDAVELARRTSPGITVVGRLCDPPASHALVDVSRGAALLVVAPRGRNALERMTLGSVSAAVVHHATCPVVVVHPGDVRSPAAPGALAPPESPGRTPAGT